MKNRQKILLVLSLTIGVSQAVTLNPVSELITLTDGTTVNATVIVTNGILASTTGIFDGNEIDDDNPLAYTITFNTAVDFFINSTQAQLGNSGDNEGVQITATGGVFTSTDLAANVTTPNGLGTNVFTFQRPNGGATSASNLDFGTVTAAGVTEISFTGLGPGSNREAFELSISANSVPEPSSVALLGLGGLAFLARRKR